MTWIYHTEERLSGERSSNVLLNMDMMIGHTYLTRWREMTGWYQQWKLYLDSMDFQAFM